MIYKIILSEEEMQTVLHGLIFFETEMIDNKKQTQGNQAIYYKFNSEEKKARDTYYTVSNQRNEQRFKKK